jgi:hypothetical protein
VRMLSGSDSYFGEDVDKALPKFSYCPRWISELFTEKQLSLLRANWVVPVDVIDDRFDQLVDWPNNKLDGTDLDEKQPKHTVEHDPEVLWNNLIQVLQLTRHSDRVLSALGGFIMQSKNTIEYIFTWHGKCDNTACT